MTKKMQYATGFYPPSPRGLDVKNPVSWGKGGYLFSIYLPGVLKEARLLCRVMQTLLVLAALYLVLASVPGYGADASEPKPLRIGVLSYRGLEHTAARWAPTAEYLQRVLPHYSVRLIPLHMDKLDHAVAEGQLDFVLTHPESYMTLHTQYGLRAVTTLMPISAGKPVTEMGGVIFVQAGRNDIRKLGDLKGKTISSAAEASIGGYRAQQWTLFKAGVEIPGDVAGIRFTGQPQDRVVWEVLEGKADVGFVRTGLLEAMMREGKIRPDQIRVINQQPKGLFPEAVSTELYPEWPFAATSNVSEDGAREVMIALLSIPPDSEAARAGDYYGFAPPADYRRLEATLLRLHVHPDRFEYFGVRDIVEKYIQPILLGLMVFFLLVVLSLLYLLRANYRARAAIRERTLLLGSLGDGIFGVDRNGICSFMNPAGLNMLGLKEEEVIGHNQHQLFHDKHPDGKPYPYEECSVYKTLKDGELRECEEWFCQKDGEMFPVQLCITPMLDQRRIVGAVISFRDISERRRIESDLRIAATAFEVQEGILITDARNQIIRVNKAFSQVTGFSPEEAIGQTPSILKSGYHDKAFYNEMWETLQSEGCWKGEVWNRRKNGEVFPEWLTISVVHAEKGEIGHYVASFLDISQNKAAEERIQYLAFYDSLTRLPNRTLVMERLGQALTSSARSGRYCALLFIDLDNFRTLNDTQGHDMGDHLLVQTAVRLLACVREVDTVARLGGDEFAVMIEGLDDGPEQAAIQVELVAEKIRSSLNLPYLLNGTEYNSSPSIGIALFRDHEDSTDELLRRGELAMYQAKATGGNGVRFFDPAMQSAVEVRAKLEADLRRAVRYQEFLLYYQLQFDARGNAIGAEALLRWQHASRGMVVPDEFIPLAEQTGLILSMGQWVLCTACQQLAIWQRNPETAHLRIAVNVSARQFRQEGFPSQVISALMGAGAQPHGLQLEITESLLLDDVEAVIGRMDHLKGLGVGFSLDDFGTGYSSLAYLKRLPLEQLKIDRSFVRDILDDPNDATITSTIIALGESLGLMVIAEGVETREQMDLLIRQGCQAFQGYYLCRPVAVGDLPLPKEL